jgi:hypothetical protein
MEKKNKEIERERVGAWGKEDEEREREWRIIGGK